MHDREFQELLTRARGSLGADVLYDAFVQALEVHARRFTPTGEWAIDSGSRQMQEMPGDRRAAMEAITYQLVTVTAAMQRVVSRPDFVIATGGQLIHSPAWSQMLADALNHRVMTSPEPEASSRGAALLVLHALGKLPRFWSTTPAPGRIFKPRARVYAIYERARQRQQDLYELLYPLSVAAGSRSKRKDLRSPTARR